MAGKQADVQVHRNAEDDDVARRLRGEIIFQLADGQRRADFLDRTALETGLAFDVEQSADAEHRTGLQRPPRLDGEPEFLAGRRVDAEPVERNLLRAERDLGGGRTRRDAIKRHALRIQFLDVHVGVEMHLVGQIHLNGGVEMDASQRIAVKGRRAADFRREQRRGHQARALHVLENAVLRAADGRLQAVADGAVDLIKQRVHELVEREILVV